MVRRRLAAGPVDDPVELFVRSLLGRPALGLDELLVGLAEGRRGPSASSRSAARAAGNAGNHAVHLVLVEHVLAASAGRRMPRAAARTTTSPSCSRAIRASRTGNRLMPWASAIASWSIRAPDARRPDRISSRSSLATSSANRSRLTGRCRYTVPSAMTGAKIRLDARADLAGSRRRCPRPAPGPGRGR